MAQTALARMDVNAEFHKSFDFRTVRTWAWNPLGPGAVKMARTGEDDPEAMRARAEPVIVDAVGSEDQKNPCLEVGRAGPCADEKT
jgi:hypothetical protein